MKRIASLVLITTLLVSCAKAPTGETTTTGEFNVARIFTVDGCTVYRFGDAGHLHYFSRCDRAASSSVSSTHTQSHGKTSSTYVQEVPTEYVEQR